MDRARLVQALEPLTGNDLARDLVANFLKLRQDAAIGTLERTSSGKFVESFVQCLQQVSSGRYDKQPSVDHYLNTQVEGDTRLPDGLRLCSGRVARAIYTMRNRRNIAHKDSEIDPNGIDLTFTYNAAVWIMAEMLRCATGISMDEAGALIRLVNAPIGTLVEEIDGTRLVHARVSLRVEILLLLHSKHPDPVTTVQLVEWTRKSRATISARLSDLKSDRQIVGDGKKGFKLTSPGYDTATAEAHKLQP